MSQPAADDATRVELPRGLALNTFCLRCPGVHRVTRLPLPDTRDERRELERELGVALFPGRGDAYAAGDVDVSGGHVIDVACDLERGLHLFDLRAAIADQARRRGFETWFGFGREMHVVGLPGETRVGSVVVQRRLRLRVVDEGWDEPETRVVARHGTRWLAGSLADTGVRVVAVGEQAERVGGDGPRRGQIVRFDGDNVVLRRDAGEVMAPAECYALSANSAFIRRHHGASTLRGVQVASGSLTSGGQRNQHAVKDRFAALAGDIAAIGFTIEMPGGRTAEIERDWVEIRIQEAP